MKTFVLVAFILLYILMFIKPKNRIFFVWSVAILFVIFGVLPVNKLIETVNWNVLLMISGTMIIVYYFIDSQMPVFLADILLAKSKNVRSIIILMSLFAGIISAFIDNVATVLMVAPVGIAICKKIRISPVGMILSIAVSSNLQGAATLVGDTTSIMLGDYANMSFTDFFWLKGHLGIFFGVELGALATIPLMMFIFRKEKATISSTHTATISSFIPTVMLLIMISALIIASLFPNAPEMTNGIICVVLGIITILIDSMCKQNKGRINQALKNIDYETLLLLGGLFIVIGGLINVGIINDFANLIVQLGKDNSFLLYTIIVWGSVVISAFIDNIPYMATMLPVITIVTNTLGVEPYIFYFGLLSGATLGGNLTPIGASANIAAIGILKKEGYHISIKEFMRIGAPYTLCAVLVGYVYFWVVYNI